MSRQTKAKVALVTGSGGGIGRAVALRMAQAGCTVGVLDRERDTAGETARLIGQASGKAVPLTADVTDPEGIAAATRELRRAAGEIDVLVNNAGIARVGSLSEMSYEDWSAQFRVNVDGPFHCCQAVVPGMVARGYGRVINISSWFAKSGAPNYGGYCASKAAVLAFTRTLALEVAASGVTANAICPGTIMNTRMREELDMRDRVTGNPTAAERQISNSFGPRRTARGHRRRGRLPDRPGGQRDRRPVDELTGSRGALIRQSGFARSDGGPVPVAGRPRGAGIACCRAVQRSRSVTEPAASPAHPAAGRGNATFRAGPMPGGPWVRVVGRCVPAGRHRCWSSITPA